MNNLFLSLDSSPWEEYLDSICDGGTASAATLLTLTDGLDEHILEEALQELEDRSISLSLAELPRPSGTSEAALRLRHEEQLVKKGLHPHDLPEGDPLRLYLEEVAMTPAFGDETLLAEQCRAGDEQAMLLLTNLSLSSVVALAMEHVGRGVLLLDLIQEGSLGLWKAIRDPDPENFSSQSKQMIRFYMARAVVLQAHANGVGQKLRTALEDYRSVDERLLAELGRNPTPEEIGEAMHISAQAAAAIADMLENARMLSRAKQQLEPEEDEIAETQAVEDTAYFQMRQRIEGLLSALSGEDAKLITLRYGLEGAAPVSPEEAGKRLGLTPEEVLTREAAALGMLRNTR